MDAVQLTPHRFKITPLHRYAATLGDDLLKIDAGSIVAEVTKSFNLLPDEEKRKYIYPEEAFGHRSIAEGDKTEDEPAPEADKTEEEPAPEAFTDALAEQIYEASAEVVEVEREVMATLREGIEAQYGPKEKHEVIGYLVYKREVLDKRNKKGKDDSTKAKPWKELSNDQKMVWNLTALEEKRCHRVEKEYFVKAFGKQWDDLHGECDRAWGHSKIWEDDIASAEPGPPLMSPPPVTAAPEASLNLAPPPSGACSPCSGSQSPQRGEG